MSIFTYTIPLLRLGLGVGLGGIAGTVFAALWPLPTSGSGRLRGRAGGEPKDDGLEGIRWGTPDGPRPRSGTSTRPHVGPVGHDANTGWSVPVEITESYLADFRPSSGEYETTEAGGLCVLGVCIAKRDVPLGFPKDHVPAPDFAAGIYTGNTPLKVEATVTLGAYKPDSIHDTDYPPCRRVDLAGEVGFEVGLDAVPIVGDWRAGIDYGQAGKPGYGWTDECEFAVGGQRPQLTCATEPGGARHLVLTLLAEKSFVLIDVSMRVWRKL